MTCPCRHPDPVLAFQYKKPPKGETQFDWKEQPYRRGFRRCKNCGHWSAKIHMDLTDFYCGSYVNGTYGGRLKETFHRILKLPPKKSDNSARVNRVLEFAKKKWGMAKIPSLLDIGSGLAVFPLRMKQAGWHVVALDPDVRAVEHAQKNAGLNAVHADFTKWRIPEGVKFDVITINKVLEHVKDPKAIIQKARLIIRKNGFVYIEVPDVAASKRGKTREEFFVEHLHVFSVKSLKLLCEQSGYTTKNLKQIKEPSGKFTIYSFAEIN
jgi:SAM-dependent methyltransferase